MTDPAEDALREALARLDDLSEASPTSGTRKDASTAPFPGGSDDLADDLATMVAAAGTAPAPPRALDPGSDDSLERRLGRVAEADRRVRAFLWLDGPRALQEAAAVEPHAPLARLAIAHKDLLLTAGQPTTAGSELLAGFVPDLDAEVVVRLRAAGAISFGKVATHEFATGVTGTVAARPAPINPRAPECIPGGSSSGSATAVAAGLVDAATGTDTGGSLRIPAACCGVVGFKPTYGTVSTRGVIPFSRTLDHVGPIAASVAVARRMFAVMSGRSVTRESERLRVIVAHELLRECDPAVADVVRDAESALAKAGVRTRSVSLPHSWGDAPALAAAIFLAEGAAFHAPGLARHPDRYQPPTRSLLARADAVSGVRYVQAQRLRRIFTQAMETLLAGADALLLPALPCVPPRLQDEAVALPEGRVDVRAALTRFTRASNLTGQPALVMPAARTAEGPVGVQLVAGRDRDARLLTVAEILERALGGAWKPEDGDLPGS